MRRILEHYGCEEMEEEHGCQHEINLAMENIRVFPKLILIFLIYRILEDLVEKHIGKRVFPGELGTQVVNSNDA